MNYSPKNLQAVLKKNNFNFKKNFGQNFIIDENIINNIVGKTGVDQDTLVIEIGPGAGALTVKLAECCKNVLCYEIDTSLKEILKEKVFHENVEIIFRDFLKCDIKQDILKYSYKKLYVIANLPYYITTPIIMKFIEDAIDIDKIVVMVQKEVGNRFKASPNSKEYSSLSVFLQYYFEIHKLFDVSRNVFIPKPNVDSIVIELIRREDRFFLKNEQLFFRLVKDSFAQKRKTLRNNLKQYNLQIIEKVLDNYNYNLSIRAEQLTIEQFVEIANALAN